jgi:hypothetical protein
VSSPGSAGSPLDRIEAQVRETFMPSRPKLAADVLALVNVAKAAHEITNPTDFRPGAAYRREQALREALAALNKEPA